MLTPVAKRVLIKPIDAPQGKILVANQKPVQFNVMAIGDEVTKVQPGNIVYLEKHYGVEIEHNGEKFTVIDESCILAKI